jgi:hypothetical protein
MTPLEEIKKDAREQIDSARLCGNVCEPNSTCEDCYRRADELAERVHALGVAVGREKTVNELAIINHNRQLLPEDFRAARNTP